MNDDKQPRIEKYGESSNEEEPLFLKNIRERLFSSEKLTKGEIIHILMIVILIITIIALSLRTVCSIDCSMCADATSTLVQRGILG